MESIEEKKLRINQLVDLIDEMNHAVVWHQERPRVDTLAVKQYSEMKARFGKELLEILTEELHTKLPIAA